MAKEIRRVEIEPAENGGHTVTHHFKDAVKHGRHGDVSHFVEPERYVFGPNDGHKMLAHVANHLQIPETEPDDHEPDGDEDDK